METNFKTPHKQLESVRRWRGNNLEASREAARRYHRENKGKIYAVQALRKKRRKKVIDRLKTLYGCTFCRFRAHPSALDFHHRDPQEKCFPIARGRLLSEARLRSELKKCIVLCANCHRRVEHGDL